MRRNGTKMTLKAARYVWTEEEHRQLIEVLETNGKDYGLMEMMIPRKSKKQLWLQVSHLHRAIIKNPKHPQSHL